MRSGRPAGYRPRVLKRLLPISVLLALALPVAAGAAPTATTSVVGGHDAPVTNWPSIAFLLAGWDEDGDGEIESGAGCTGTVIAPDWILTAAHCAFRPDGQPVDAMLSITGVSDVNDPIGEAIPADQLIVHPNWNPSTLLGEAMLMHLEASSSRTSMPIARPGGQYATDASIPNVAGWGTIDEDSTLGTDVLQETYLGLVDDETCAAFASGYDAASQLCAGTFEVSGVCHGDSGGPLTVVDAADRQYLYGLTSYGPQLDHAGFKPCDLRSPAVFTWVPAFAAWVDEQTTEILPTPLPPDDDGANPARRSRSPRGRSRRRRATRRRPS